MISFNLTYHPVRNYNFHFAGVETHFKQVKLLISSCWKTQDVDDHLHWWSVIPLSLDCGLPWAFSLAPGKTLPTAVWDDNGLSLWHSLSLCGFRFVQPCFSVSLWSTDCLAVWPHPALLSPTHMWFSSTESNVKAARLDGRQGHIVTTICLLEWSMWLITEVIQSPACF